MQKTYRNYNVINPTDFLLFSECEGKKQDDFIRVVILLCFYHNDKKELKKSTVKEVVNNLYHQKFTEVRITDKEINSVFANLQKNGYLKPREKGSPYWVTVGQFFLNNVRKS